MSHQRLKLFDLPREALSSAISRYFESVAENGKASGDGTALAEATRILESIPVDNVPDIAPLPPGSRGGPQPNPLFVNRVEELKALSNFIRQSSQQQSPGGIVVSGLGGAGKTQVVSEFTNRYGQFFVGGVFWISFAEPESIPLQVAACGGPGAMNLVPDFDSRSAVDQVRMVLSEWLGAMPRLLVFDNCEDEELFVRWRPRQRSGCRAIVTSRRRNWSASLGLTRLDLSVLQRKASVQLLQNFREDLAQDLEIAEAIAAELGDLPLALHLAGAFLRRHQHSSIGVPNSYLETLRGPAILDHPSLGAGDRSPTGHSQDLRRTLAMSFELLDPDLSEDRLSLIVLTLASTFAEGEPIPRSLISSATQDFAEAVSEIDLGEAFLRLEDLGLLEIWANGDVLIHPIVAAFVRERSGNITEIEKAANVAIESEADRLNQLGRPSELAAWVAHLYQAAERALNRDDPRAGGLCNQLGYHLLQNGSLKAAHAAFERALRVWGQKFGPESPKVALAWNNLGTTLQELGELAEARDALEKSLAISIVVFGENHPEVARVRNNLGSLLRELGELESARAILNQALAIDEKVLGIRHPQTIQSLNNLGAVLEDLGDLQGARNSFERSLSLSEEVFGPDDPRISAQRSNLGAVLFALGDYDAARAVFESALAMDEGVFGVDHPRIATRLSNLGGVLLAQGDLAGAASCFERALEIERAVWGAAPHPDIAGSLHQLAGVRKAQGDLSGARLHLEQALEIYLEVFGTDQHPDVAECFRALAGVLQAQGDLDGARQYLERTLEIERAVFGSDRHPGIATSLHQLATILQAQGDLAAAKETLESALELKISTLGRDQHPSIAASLHALGGVLQALGDLSGAEEHLKRSLEISQAVHGTDRHPDVTASLHQLAAVLRAKGDMAAARKLLERVLEIEEGFYGGRSHYSTAQTEVALGVLLLELGKSEEAIKHLRHASEVYQAILGGEHPSTKWLSALLKEL